MSRSRPSARRAPAAACSALADVLADGSAAGAAAVDAPAPAPFAVEGAPSAHGGFLGLAPARVAASASTAFVDFQNDVTARDVTLAAREGMRSIEHIKRYTTTGMATDQGKTSNMNALAIAAQALGKSVPQVGLTTFRLPYAPVTFAAFAGMSRRELFDPVRQTPMHGWAGRTARFSKKPACGSAPPASRAPARTRRPR